MDRRSFLLQGLGGTALVPLLARHRIIASEDQPESDWPNRRKAIRRRWLELLGPFPDKKCPLEPTMRKVAHGSGITRYHVSYASEPDDRVTAWLLVPDSAKKEGNPVVICVHGTTRGSGKDRTVGLAGHWPHDPPDPPETSRSYGLELARRGYVTLNVDMLGDGQRAKDGLYDSRAFYRRHPQWSIVGKYTWDVIRSVDYLETLDLVDSKRIGCLGHSLGGHTTAFAAAFEPRLAASCSNCGVLSWFTKLQDRYHWARPESGILEDGPPALALIYIKKFARYYRTGAGEAPIDFDSLFMLAAPNPLLIMSCEPEVDDYRLVDKVDRARRVYRELGAEERLDLFSFPGGHNFPPAAKRVAFQWFDRWLRSEG